MTDRTDGSIANESLRMPAGETPASSEGTEQEAEVKLVTRQCLKCQASFESTWSGERVCRKCKSSSSWRGGR